MENIVFFFSGTGNSLKVAKSVISELGGGEIVSMAKSGSAELKKQYDTIGFVFPTYFMGAPDRVIDFITNLNLGNNKKAYFYIISTCGAFSGTAVAQTRKLINDKHGVNVNYSKGLRMVSNYIVMYDVSKKTGEIIQKSDKKLASIANSIKRGKNNRINWFFRILASLKPSNDVSNMDRDYNVNNNCIGCGICKAVCPAKNIEMVNNKPQFRHQCEQCVACIQFCPQKAINYKNVTQDRGRYTNPEIDYTELSKYNNM